MAYDSINSTNVAAGKPVTTGLMNKVRTNFDDHESRINSVETGGGAKTVIFSEVVNLETARVGEIVWSLLSETEFQKRYGAEWKLIKGQSLSGTDLESFLGPTAPDARGDFLRLKDNGRGRDPQGDSSIGTSRSDILKSHMHYEETTTSNSTGSSSARYADNSDNFINAGADEPITYDGDGVPKTVKRGNRVLYGSSETAPKHVLVNAFTKENDTIIDYTRIFRAPAGINIVSATISSLIAGTSGNLEVDILKGSTLGTMATMLNSNISLGFAAGNYATSSEGDFAVNTLAQNDFLRVDIKSTQVNQSEFYLNVYGESS